MHKTISLNCTLLTYPGAVQPPTQGVVSCSELPEHLKSVADYLQTVHQQQHQSQPLLYQMFPLSSSVLQLHNSHCLKNNFTAENLPFGTGINSRHNLHNTGI